MGFFENYGKEIVSLLVPLITLLLNKYLRSKAKLEVAWPHQFTFLLQQPIIDAQGKQLAPSQIVYTNSIIVRNSGSEPATNVELVFNWKPMCLNLWPIRHYKEYSEPDNRYVLIFDSLAPGEVLACEILSMNIEPPKLITVRSTECIAKNINMYPQPVVSNAIRLIASALIFLGFATSIYFIIILIQFLVLKTPFAR